MTDSTHIQIPIYGKIELTEPERRVLDTPPVQRLRRIRQLGLSSLVYPGATHTRFVHSLGVMHVAGRFAESIGLDETSTTEARMAGLLHDAGHGPYSHASEIVTERDGEPHEELSCEVVDELAGTIPADAERVKDYIRGEAAVNIVAGTVDADRMDYLKRDSHAADVSYGSIDTETIIEAATIVDNQLAFEAKARHAIEDFIIGRYHMNTAVYNHHTSRISEAMLQRALDHYVKSDGATKQLSRMDDYQMHTALLNAEDPARYLFERILNRNLYKRCVELNEDNLTKDSLRWLEQNTNPRDVEERIADAAGIDPVNIIVDPPTTPKKKPYRIPLAENGNIRYLNDVSPVAETLREAEWSISRFSVYTPEKHRDSVADDAEQVVYDILDAQ